MGKKKFRGKRQPNVQNSREPGKERPPNNCPICGGSEYFTNPVLTQIGLVLCSNPSCGNAFNPLVFKLREAMNSQAEAIKKEEETSKERKEKAMSGKEFERLREEYKDLIVKP